MEYKVMRIGESDSKKASKENAYKKEILDYLKPLLVDYIVAKTNETIHGGN